MAPVVTIHFAQSIDGRISFEKKRARLSSNDGLLFAQRARAENDAVVVGVRTVEIDDPRLTLRDVSGTPPRRVVLSSTLTIPEDARLFQEAGGEIIVVGAKGRADPAARDRLEKRGARALIVDAAEHGWVSPAAAIAALADLGVARVLVEGGARVLSSFLRHKLARHAFVEIAPVFLGGPATPALDALAACTTSLENARAEQIGSHMFLRGDLAYA